MTNTVNVLLVETDELELHERVEQLLMDGYAVDAVAAADQRNPAVGRDYSARDPRRCRLWPDAAVWL